MACPACLPELDSAQGERVLYEHSESAQPCAGNVAYLDRVVISLEQQLGVTAPRHLRYSWLIDDTALPPGVFRPGTVDWAVGGHAISHAPALVHEVVHLVAARTTAPFFREGLAVTFDLLQPNGTGPRYREKMDFDPRRTMAALNYTDVEYIEAGFFVSFLLTRHGPEKFRSFYTRIPPPYSMALIRSAFRSAYTLDLDDEVELFMSGPPPCEVGYFPVQLSDCSAPLQAWQDGAWRLSEVLDCESPEVVGGTWGERSAASFHQHTLEVEAPGMYVLETSGDEDVWIRFGRCFGCVWEDSDYWFRQGEKHLIDLSVGKYFLRVSGDSDRSPRINVVLKPA